MPSDSAKLCAGAPPNGTRGTEGSSTRFFLYAHSGSSSKMSGIGGVFSAHRGASPLHGKPSRRPSYAFVRAAARHGAQQRPQAANARGSARRGSLCCLSAGALTKRPRSPVQSRTEAPTRAHGDACVRGERGNGIHTARSVFRCDSLAQDCCAAKLRSVALALLPSPTHTAHRGSPPKRCVELTHWHGLNLPREIARGVEEHAVFAIQRHDSAAKRAFPLVLRMCDLGRGS